MAKKKAPEKEPVEITDVEKKLDVADSALTKFGIILKKHWGKLLLILLGYLAYQFCVLVKEEMDRDAAMDYPVEETVSTPFDNTVYDSTEYYYTEDTTNTIPE